MARPILNRWSMHYPECKSCGTTEIPHKGKGYCNNCHQKKRRRTLVEEYINRDSVCCRRGVKRKNGWRGARVYDNLMGEGTSFTVEPFKIDGESHVVVAFDSIPSPIQWKTEELRRIA